ncbi:MAG TPA: VOC family protein [Jiangellaceae bacterium]
MLNSVVHFEIGAQDSTKIRAFYTSLFGWTFDTTDPSYGVMDDSDGGIGGGIMQIREDMPPYVTIYVAVDDLSATLTRAEELGGARVLGPTPIPPIGEFALFNDPEGHLIGLLHLNRPQ